MGKTFKKLVDTNFQQIPKKGNEFLYYTFPFITFFVGIGYFCMRILGYDWAFIPGDLGDSRFINFLLEHGFRWLKGDVDNFWDAGFMYPFKNTIALSDSMLGTLPIYSLFRVLNFSPETAYQLWWISIYALNYWLSYFVFKKWFQKPLIAVVLAYIFAFSIFNLGQLNYMQMAIRFMVPVVFYAAYKLANAPSIKYLSIYCFALVFQIYCVAYTGFYLLYFSALFIVIYCFLSKNWVVFTYFFKRENVIYTSILFLISLTALLWLLMPYQSMSKVVGLRWYREVIVNLPLWNSFLFPHEATITWRFLVDWAKPNVTEWWLQSVFAGIIPLLAVLIPPFYLLYKFYKKSTVPILLKSLIITSTIIVLLHIRTEGGLSLYALIFKLPGINSMRVLSRFMHVELFILLLLFGYFLEKIKPHHFVFAVLLVFADNLFSPNFIPREKKAELIVRKELLLNKIDQSEAKKVKAIAFINQTQPHFVTHLDMMLVAQQLGVKTINGYSSYCPDDFGEFFLENSESGLLKWLESNQIRKEDVLVVND